MGKIKVTDVTITNCLPESAAHHWVDPEILAQQKAQEQKEQEAKEAADKKGTVGIIIGVVVGIAAAGVIIFLITTKKSDKDFDINLGRYVDKKKAKRDIEEKDEAKK